MRLNIYLNWIALAVLLPMVQIEPQLYLMAAAVACLLWSALSALPAPGEHYQLPGGRIATFAALHLAWLFSVHWHSTVPSISYWFAWILGLLPLAYMLGRQIGGDPRRDDSLLRGFQALGLVCGLWACIQFFDGAVRANGPFLDYNSFGALLYLIVLPTLPALAFSEPRRKRLLRYAALAVMLLALFATFSRGAIAVTLVILPLALMVMRRSGLPIRRPAIAVVAIAIGCYCIVKLYAPAPGRTLDIEHDPSMLFRLMMWKSALTAWLDYPIWGTGLGSYRLQYLHYRSPEEIDTTGSLAHNDYVQLLMEAGPLSVLLLLAWGFAALALLYHHWLRAGDPDAPVESRYQSATAATLLLAVGGLFAHALINFIFYVAPLSLLAGFYLGIAHSAIGAPLFEFRLPIRRRLATGLAVLVCGLLTTGLLLDWAASAALTPTVADSRWSLASKPVDARYRAASAFAALRPQSIAAQQTLSSAAAEIAARAIQPTDRSAWSQRSLAHAKDWLSVSQANPLAYLALGRLLWQFPQLSAQMAPLPTQPAALFAIAIDRYPANPDGYRLLASFLTSQGDEISALEQLGSAAPWIHIPANSQAQVDSWQALIREGQVLCARLANNPDPRAGAAIESFTKLLDSVAAAS